MNFAKAEKYAGYTGNALKPSCQMKTKTFNWTNTQHSVLAIDCTVSPWLYFPRWTVTCLQASRVTDRNYIHSIFLVKISI